MRKRKTKKALPTSKEETEPAMELDGRSRPEQHAVKRSETGGGGHGASSGVCNESTEVFGQSTHSEDSTSPARRDESVATHMDESVMEDASSSTQNQGVVDTRNKKLPGLDSNSMNSTELKKQGAKVKTAMQSKAEKQRMKAVDEKLKDQVCDYTGQANANGQATGNFPIASRIAVGQMPTYSDAARGAAAGTKSTKSIEKPTRVLLRRRLKIIEVGWDGADDHTYPVAQDRQDTGTNSSALDARVPSYSAMDQQVARQDAETIKVGPSHDVADNDHTYSVAQDRQDTDTNSSAIDAAVPSYSAMAKQVARQDAETIKVGPSHDVADDHTYSVA